MKGGRVLLRGRPVGGPLRTVATTEHRDRRPYATIDWPGYYAALMRELAAGTKARA